MLEPNSDLEQNLIAQSMRGDRGAFGELVLRHYEGVIRVVYRLCGDAQIAQDAAQDAFIRAWVKLPGFQPRGSFQVAFRNWLYRIALNAALDTLRKKPEESIETGKDAMAVAEKGSGPEAAFIKKEETDYVQGVVRSLPEAARAVLVLREYGELSYDEIASVLEIPVGTVMSRLSYARGRLRERLQIYRAEMEREYA